MRSFFPCEFSTTTNAILAQIAYQSVKVTTRYYVGWLVMALVARDNEAIPGTDCR